LTPAYEILANPPGVADDEQDVVKGRYRLRGGQVSREFSFRFHGVMIFWLL
jgi:hypothetical protein